LSVIFDELYKRQDNQEKKTVNRYQVWRVVEISIYQCFSAYMKSQIKDGGRKTDNTAYLILLLR